MSVLWTPSDKRVSESNLTSYQTFLAENYDQKFANYEELHAWSVQDRGQFWGSLWDYFEVLRSEEASSIIENKDQMMDTQWFPGAKLNFAENLLRFNNETTALLFRNELGQEKRITYVELRKEVQCMASALKKQGIKKGDRVAGLLPNIIESVIAMLATTSLGAIWSSTSPDFGFQGVLDRFGQIEPRVLITVDGYYYKGKEIDCQEKVAEIAKAIPSLEKVVFASYLGKSLSSEGFEIASTWEDFRDDNPLPLQFEQLPFNHPIYIMYSSGTTGVPKCIVHGAGGSLLQHLKEHRLHMDLKPQEALFYFTTCGWMMWNWLVSGLASGATLLLFDGNPFYPGPEVLWQFAEDHNMTYFGTSAKYLSALEKEGFVPKDNYQLESLKGILSTGSPLSAPSFDYVYNSIKSDVHLASICGGTDIISCFMLGVPTIPVHREEIQAKGLGMDIHAFDQQEVSVVGEKGELVCTASFPSQPVGFWKDPDRKKYKQAYFSVYDNVWRHGDFIKVTENQGVIVYGRSDATLNPGGVRIGTAEIYRAVETIDVVLDSLVVGHQLADDVAVVLFVKMKEGQALTEELTKHIRTTIRKQTTPRHVPAFLFQTPDIPYTLSGKKVELAVRRVLQGLDVPNRDALANPESLEYFKQVQIN